MADIILYGTNSENFLEYSSSCLRPINLLIANKVFSGFVTACLLAGCPTNRSSSVMPTMDGVVLAPSLFSIILGDLPSITDTHEFVVPKSIPITFAINALPKFRIIPKN